VGLQHRLPRRRDSVVGTVVAELSGGRKARNLRVVWDLQGAVGAGVIVQGQGLEMERWWLRDFAIVWCG
jgi:hypothetical protein